MENWPTLFLRQSIHFYTKKQFEWICCKRSKCCQLQWLLALFSDYHIRLTKAWYQTHKYVTGYKKWDTYAYYSLVLRLTMLWILKCIIGKSTFHIYALCMCMCMCIHLVHAGFTIFLFLFFFFAPFPFAFLFMMLSQYFGVWCHSIFRFTFAPSFMISSVQHTYWCLR